jgi:AraC-like DNA-binding protein
MNRRTVPPPPLEILIQGSDRLEIVKEVPEKLFTQSLKGSEGFRVTHDLGDMLFRHITGDNFEIWYSNYMLVKNTMIIGRGNFPVLELHIPFKNHFVSWWDGFGETKLKSGQFELSYAPYVNNLTEFHGGKHYHTFDVHYTRSFLEGYAEHYDLLKRFLEKVDRGEPANLLGVTQYLSPEMIMLVNQILAYNGDDCLAPLFYDSAIGLLTTMLFNRLSGINADAPVTFSPEHIRMTEEAKDFLVSDLSKKYLTRELARKVGLNVCTLQKCFKHLFGATIFNYGQTARLDHAWLLLISTKDSIQTIALKCGYPDHANLTAAFITNFGFRPKDVRKDGVIRNILPKR